MILRSLIIAILFVAFICVISDAFSFSFTGLTSGTTNHLVSSTDESRDGPSMLPPKKPLLEHKPEHKPEKKPSLALALLGDRDISYKSKLEPVNTPIDIHKYMGKWYEIFRKPMSAQSQCDSNVSATYTFSATTNSVFLTNQCTRADGTIASSHGEAFVQNSPINSRLRVSFLPTSFLRKAITMAQGDYWVIDIHKDDNGDYEYALIGEPRKRFVWLLSRTPHVDSDIAQHYYNVAKNMGYDMSNIIYTKQDGF